MNEMHGYDIEDLNIGMVATYAKTITEADIVLFSAVSGDNNAMHTNEEFAQSTEFGGKDRAWIPYRERHFGGSLQPAPWPRRRLCESEPDVPCSCAPG